MQERSTVGERKVETSNERSIARVIDSAGWGLFFLWVGVALLLDIGWGPGLIGVGVITLGGQVARRYYGLSIESFWVAVAVLFVLGGVWELLQIRVSLVPVLAIVAGVVLLISAMRRR